jgi:hypothetical protein
LKLKVLLVIFRVSDPGQLNRFLSQSDQPEKAHSYQYSFAPNPHWSNLYAPGSEIQQYLESVAVRFGATRFIKTSHMVEGCTWDDAEKKWSAARYPPEIANI